MQAIKIKSDGAVEPLDTDLSFEEIQKFCASESGGPDERSKFETHATIERVQFPWGEVWCNENGIALKLDVNRKATIACSMPYPLLGPCVLRVKKGYNYSNTDQELHIQRDGRKGRRDGRSRAGQRV